MKRLTSLLLCFCVLMTFMPTTFALTAPSNEPPLPAAGEEVVGDDFAALEEKYTGTNTVYDLENEENVPAKPPVTPPEKPTTPGEDDSQIYGDESFNAENSLQLENEYVIDEIIVKFKDPDQVPGMEEQLQLEIDKVEKIGIVDALGVYVIKVSDFDEDPNAVLNRFKNNKYVDYVEPNYIMQLELVPDDPNYKTHQSLVLSAINAQSGWDIITGTSTPIIAVVDSGVARHYDMSPLLPGYSAVESLSPNYDKRGHGTGVAGIIGMIGNNKVGGAGINWNASILPVKVDDANGNPSSANIAKGIIWAADNGAMVINLSIGTTADSRTIRDAVNYAYEKGCALIAGAGNNGKEGLLYPARYDNVLAVGAASGTTKRTPYSNYGDGLNVMAASGYYTTGTTGGYVNQSGTSFAAPQVSALASMMWAVNPDLTNDEIYRMIEEGAQTPDSGYTVQMGYGMIDIGTTLEMAVASLGEELPVTEPLPPESEQEVWTAPTIMLDGFAEMALAYGQEYIEAGYTAEDCQLTDITEAVIVTSTIDIWTPGIYTVTYDVTDSKDFTARAVRTVTVAEEPETTEPAEAPVIAPNGSNPIVLHLTSGTPYTEQGARAVDYDGTDLSDLVEIEGDIDRDTPGTYTLTYSITSPESGITSTATRDVRIVAPTETKDERTEYNISGMAKKGGKVTHGGFVCNEAGFMDFTVNSLGNGVVITVELINAETGDAMFTDTFTSAGTMQYSILEGQYKLTTKIEDAAGIAKFSMGMLMPESTMYTFGEVEVPLTYLPMPQIAPIGSNPIILHIGGTPYFEQGARATDFNGVNLSGKVEIIGAPNTRVAGTYTITYKVVNAFGFEATATRDVRILDPKDKTKILEAEVPLVDTPNSYTVVLDDCLWSIALELYGDGDRWPELYEKNKDIIGDNPDKIHVGQQFKI